MDAEQLISGKNLNDAVLSHEAMKSSKLINLIAFLQVKQIFVKFFITENVFEAKQFEAVF